MTDSSITTNNDDENTNVTLIIVTMILVTTEKCLLYLPCHVENMQKAGVRVTQRSHPNKFYFRNEHLLAASQIKYSL